MKPTNPHFGGSVTSGRAPKSKHFGFRELAEIAMDTFWGARGSSNSLAFFGYEFFCCIFQQLEPKCMSSNDFVHFHSISNSARTARYSKNQWMVWSFNKMIWRPMRAFTATIHPKRSAGGIAGRLCRPLPRHSDECT